METHHFSNGLPLFCHMPREVRLAGLRKGRDFMNRPGERDDALDRCELQPGSVGVGGRLRDHVAGKPKNSPGFTRGSACFEAILWVPSC